MSTLYLTQPGSQLHKADERLVIKKGDEVLDAIPLIKVDQVVLMGRGVSVTTSALHALTRPRRGCGLSDRSRWVCLAHDRLGA